ARRWPTGHGVPPAGSSFAPGPGDPQSLTEDPMWKRDALPLPRPATMPTQAASEQTQPITVLTRPVEKPSAETVVVNLGQSKRILSTTRPTIAARPPAPPQRSAIQPPPVPAIAGPKTEPKNPVTPAAAPAA